MNGESKMGSVNIGPPASVAIGLRPSTNNFKGSDLNDLIAVPAMVPMPATAVVRRRSGESRGYCPKLRCNSRKARRSFALESPIANK